MQRKVQIVGAATAGLVAARRLAELGIEVSVHDQKHVLGHPVRASGILSLSGLSTLGIGYQSAITNTLHGANIRCNGKVMRIVSKRPMAHVLDRKRLNEICRYEAEAAGAQVETGRRVTGADLDRMRGSGIIIGADGAVSTVARHFSLGSIKRMLITYKAEFDVDVTEPHMVDLFFDKAKYHGLFAWLCPNSESLLEVGVGIDSDSGNAKRTFDAFIKDPYVSALLSGKSPVTEGASVIPMALRERLVDESNGILLVGDAAGQVKPTTGGGIIFGGNAALMAADVVNEYFAGNTRLSEYRRRFMRSYGLDLRMHSAINRIYSSFGARGMGIAIDLMNALGIDRFLGTYGDMDRPSLIAKRFFLRGLA